MKPRFERKPDGSLRAFVSERGRALLCNALVNKGTAFTHEERRVFELAGLLPYEPCDFDVQVQRAYQNIAVKTDPLERYVGMAALQDRNEVLFYEVLRQHVEELMPIVYTPTVGEACRFYSRIFRRGRGLWLTPEHSGQLVDVLKNGGDGNTRLIVVTDNERILGLGDQGAGGMGIPVGKLALYTLGAGIHPAQTLPISLDVGTDNQELLNDPMYLGYRQPRLRGERYYQFVQEFVEAVRVVCPNALLQWEDFKKANAFTLLHRYRKQLLSFNDDIQGTAAVALSGVMAACRKLGVALQDQRVVILGAGAAGIGIGHQLRDALAREGVSGEALTRAIAVLDSQGLILESSVDEDHKREFAWPLELVKHLELSPDGPLGLLEVVRALKPTVLIGTSGQPGVFTKEVVKAMAAGTPNPAIFPYSNPTSQAEAKPQDLLAWTDGRALVATGSPFEPVEHGGRTIKIGQGNNVYVFPGVGLGALAARAVEVTDSMFTAAAEALAAAVDQDDLDQGSLYPPLTELGALSRTIALAVAREAIERGVAPPASEAALEQAVENLSWRPHYPEMIPA